MPKGRCACWRPLETPLSPIEADIKDVARDSRDLADVFFMELPNKIRAPQQDDEDHSRSATPIA